MCNLTLTKDLNRGKNFVQSILFTPHLVCQERRAQKVKEHSNLCIATFE